jgi:hypothetical protein
MLPESTASLIATGTTFYAVVTLVPFLAIRSLIAKLIVAFVVAIIATYLFGVMAGHPAFFWTKENLTQVILGMICSLALSIGIRRIWSLLKVRSVRKSAR